MGAPSCYKFGNIAEVLPGSLSTKVRHELTTACGKVSSKVKKKGKDLESLIEGDLSAISKETWTELAEAAKSIAKSNSAPPADDPLKRPGKADKYKNPHKITDGKGSRLRMRVPIKLSGSTDVHVLLNYDKKKLLEGKPTVNGAGIGVTHKIGSHTKLDARFYVDTSESKRNAGGSFTVQIEF